MGSPTKRVATSVVCAGMLFGASSTWAQYLTGADRESFVKATFNGCMRPKNTDPVTASVPVPIFEAMCRCYANGLADRLPARELMAENSTVMDPVIKELSKACYEAVKTETLRRSGNTK
jgi:hypothetical protein